MKLVDIEVQCFGMVDIVMDVVRLDKDCEVFDSWFGDIQGKFVEMEFDKVEFRVVSILVGFGFLFERQQFVIKIFFGGWCMCLVFVRVFFCEFDFLFFDELFNMLDVLFIIFFFNYF